MDFYFDSKIDKVQHFAGGSEMPPTWKTKIDKFLLLGHTKISFSESIYLNNVQKYPLDNLRTEIHIFNTELASPNLGEELIEKIKSQPYKLAEDSIIDLDKNTGIIRFIYGQEEHETYIIIALFASQETYSNTAQLFDSISDTNTSLSLRCSIGNTTTNLLQDFLYGNDDGDPIPLYVNQFAFN